MSETRDCRTCTHNSYIGDLALVDWVSCHHPVTLAKAPKWKLGDPAFVAMRTSDLPVVRIAEVSDCPAWELQT